ncbi:hypothetical protein ACW2Q0_28400 [Nocardia sp. R16R-3T]
MIEPTNLLDRITLVIEGDARRSADPDHAIANPGQVAAGILADIELCAAIGNYAAANDPHDAVRQLEAIDLVLAHLNEYRTTAISGWFALRTELERFRHRVEERLTEDTDLGTAYLTYAEQAQCCHTPAGVGGLIRAAVAKTGATITPGPRPADPTPAADHG